MRLIYTLPMITALAACATLMEGDTQRIHIHTTHDTRARCLLSNERGSWEALVPGMASVKRSQSDLNISCTGADGARVEETFAAQGESWTFANLVFGFGSFIGFGIDALTSSMFSYSDSLSVALNDMEQKIIQANKPAPSGTCGHQAHAADAPMLCFSSLNWSEKELKIRKSSNKIILSAVND